jgi:four helix bundle protein
MRGEKIKNFTDLIAWQEGHALVLHIYQMTKKIPDDERFGLVSQMRRCAVSITSNIAEGFGRRTSKDKIRFYDTALGSLFELQNQLLLAKDLEYIERFIYSQIFSQTIQTNRLLNGLIKSAP